MTQTQAPGQKAPGQKAPGQKAPGQKAPGQKAPGQKAPAQRPPGPQPSGSITLTGRGAVLALLAASFLGLLIAAWTGWSLFADVMFVTACGVVTCYTRFSGLRAVVVCPPLVFLAGSVLAQVLTAADAFSAAAGILVTLGSSALWLFTGTALVVVIALGRGYRPEVPAIPLLSRLRLSRVHERLKDVYESARGGDASGRSRRR